MSNSIFKSLIQTVCLFVVCTMMALSSTTVANARFLTPDTWDPILAGVDFNRYAYGANDPVNQSDPNGHMAGPCGNCGVIPGYDPSLSELSHFGLGALGFAPGVGAVPDLIDSGLYKLEGEDANAALSAVAAIPAYGDGVKAGTISSKALLKSIRQAGYDIHHVLPRSVAKDPFLKEIGFSVESNFNRIALPRNISVDSLRTIHRGKHATAYTEHFKNLVRNLERQVASGKLTKQEALDQLRKDVTDMRQKLRTNQERLNKASDEKPGMASNGGNGNSGNGNVNCGGRCAER